MFYAKQEVNQMINKKLKSYSLLLSIFMSFLLSGCSDAPVESTNESRLTESSSELTAVADVSEVAEAVDVVDAANDANESEKVPINKLSDEEVKALISIDDISDITINSHDLKEISNSEYGEQFIAQDTVNVTYSAGNLTGIFPQTVSKTIEFYLNKDTSKWENLADTTTACDVDNSALPGSSWKCESIDSVSLESLFGDEIQSDETGVLYFHFLKRAGLFSFNLSNENNTSSERFFTTVGTSGKLNWIGTSGNIEKSFNITNGSITDSGEVIFEISCDSSTVPMSFGTEVVSISEHEYDEALGLEVDEDKVYMDTLPVFNVSSASIENGEWKTQTGLKDANLSPELSWDAVDGASKYAVLMIDDTTANNWFHWYALVDKTHLDEGEYTDIESGYAGPYPPDTHEYDVYVIALRDEPSNFFCKLDTPGGDIFERLNALNTATDGSTGNVLAYGLVEANYTPTEAYYRSR